MTNEPNKPEELEQNLPGSDKALSDLEKDISTNVLSKQIEQISDSKNTDKEILYLGGEVSTGTLHQEIVGTQVDSLEAQVDYLMKHGMDMTVDEIENSDNDTLKLALASTFLHIGYGGIGSLLKKEISLQTPNWQKDGFQEEQAGSIAKKFGSYPITNAETLLKGLTDAKADVSQETKLLTFLGTSGSKLVDDISENHISSIYQQFSTQSKSFLLSYNDIIGLKPDEKRSLMKFLNDSMADMVDGEKWSKEGNRDGPKGLLAMLGIVGGGTAAGWTLRKSLGFGKEKKDLNFFNKSMRWIGEKTLVWGSAGTLLHRWFTGKWWRDGMFDSNGGNDTGIGDVLNDVTSAPASLEKSPERKEYEYFGNQVNLYYTIVGKQTDADALGSGPEKYAGAIPNSMDNSFKTINDSQSLRGLFYVSAIKSKNDVLNLFSSFLNNGFKTFAGELLSRAGFGFVKPLSDKSLDVLSNWLSTKNNLETIQRVIRQLQRTWSYTSALENAYLEKKIIDGLNSGDKLFSGDDEIDISTQAKKKRRIRKLTRKGDKGLEGYRIGNVPLQSIKSTFRANTYAGLAKVIKDEKLSASVVYNSLSNTDVKERSEELEKERDQVMSDLEKDKIGTLDSLQSDVENRIEEHFENAWSDAIPLLNVFRGADIWEEHIKESTGYKDIILAYKDKFEEAKTEDDLVKVKATIDEYFADLNKIDATEFNVEQIVDEQGNVLINVSTGIAVAGYRSFKHIGLGFNYLITGGIEAASGSVVNGTKQMCYGIGTMVLSEKGMESIGSGIENIGNGNIVDGVSDVGYGVGVAAGSAWSAAACTHYGLRFTKTILGKGIAGRLLKKPLKFGIKHTGRLFTAPARGLYSAGKYTIKEGIPSLVNYAKNSDKLSKGLHLGKDALQSLGSAGLKLSIQGIEFISTQLAKYLANPNLSGLQRRGIIEAQNISTKLLMLFKSGDSEFVQTAVRFFNNPILKSLGKYVPLLATVGFGLVEYNLLKGEIDLLEHNKDRQANRISDLNFTMVKVGLSSTLAVVALANGWNPVGWTLAAMLALEAGFEATIGVYFDILDKYHQNVQDFKQMHMGVLKQNLVGYIASEKGEQRGWQDQITRGTGDVLDFLPVVPGVNSLEQNEIIGTNTIPQAFQAMIELEESQKYPLVYMTESDILLAGTPKEQEQARKDVEEAKRLYAAAVNKRFSYIQETYFSNTASLLSSDEITTGNGIKRIDQILLDSEQVKYLDEKGSSEDFMTYKKERLLDIKSSHGTFFRFIPTLSEDDKLFLYNSAINYLQIGSSIDEDDLQGPDKLLLERAKIIKEIIHLEHLEDGFPSDLDIQLHSPDVQGFEYLLEHGEWSASTFSHDKIVEHIEHGHVNLMTNSQIGDLYKVSPNIGQNVLYEIMSSSYGYKGPNTLSHIQNFFGSGDRTDTGIYYDIIDDEFVFDGYDYGIRQLNFRRNSNAKYTLPVSKLNDLETLKGLSDYFKEYGIEVHSDNGTATNSLSLERTKGAAALVEKHISYRENKDQTKQKLLSFIKDNSKGDFISFSHYPNYLREGTRSGLSGLGMHLYRRDYENDALISTSVPGVSNGICPLTNEFPESYVFFDWIPDDPDKNEYLDIVLPELLPSVTRISENYTDIKRLLSVGKGDLDPSNAVVDFIDKKISLWKERQKELQFLSLSMTDAEGQAELDRLIKLESKKADHLYISLLSSVYFSDYGSNDLDNFSDLQNLYRFESTTPLFAEFTKTRTGLEDFSFPQFIGKDSISSAFKGTFNKIQVTIDGEKKNLSSFYPGINYSVREKAEPYVVLAMKAYIQCCVANLDSNNKVSSFKSRKVNSEKYYALLKKYIKAYEDERDKEPIV